MSSWLVRLVGATLALSGTAAFWLGLRHLKLASLEDVYVQFHQAAACLLLPAGLLLACEGCRLSLQPSHWSAYPFLRRLAFYRWLLFGWLGVFFVLGLWLPGQDLARFPCRGACALWAALVLGPLLLPARWIAWSDGLLTTGPLRILDLLVGNLVILAILLEVALRIMALGTGQDALLLNRTAGYRLKPGDYPNGLHANQLGFADEEWTLAKPSDRIRIAALGDSFSVGTAVAYGDNYLTQLETALGGVEVCNFGVCGTGPREYQHLLATMVWNYQPDLVLVPIFIGNDITEWIATPSLAKFHPDALYVELLARRLGRLAREHWRSRAEGDTGDYRMGLGPSFSHRTYVELTAGRLVVCRSPMLPPDEARWRLVEEYLDRIIKDCRSHQTPVAFVLIADEFQVHDALRSEAMVAQGWSEREIDLRLPQRRLSALAAERQVPCLDLLPSFAELGAAGHIPNDGHWSKAGHRLAASVVAQWLREQFPETLDRKAEQQAAKQSTP